MMKLENIVKIIVPAIFAANTAYANEAIVATPKQIADVIKGNDNTEASPNNKEDWSHLKNLIESGEATVLIQPVKDKPGHCEVGLDGFPQKYELPADAREKDGELRKAELILNLGEKNPENRFYFPCDLKAETPKPTPLTPTTPTTPIVPAPVPEPVPEISKLPFLMFSPGASYMQILGNQDKKYDNSGILRGGNLSLTVQPSFTNWYWGGRFLAYGNASSDHTDLEVPAAKGPLAGKLVMRGKNEYSLENFGIGAGSIVGYMIPVDKKGRWGMGLELEHGIMHDWVTREFTESSAHYINDTIVEGTDISNHSDDTNTHFYGYSMGGLRFKAPFVCGIISGGIRTDASEVDRMFSIGIAYCPNKE